MGNLLDLFDPIHSLLCDRSKSILRFALHDARMEGWLQGEVLCKLLDEIDAGKPWEVVDVNKQHGGGNKRPDFTVKIDGTEYLLETKAVVGKRGSYSSLARDVVKLRNWGDTGAVLILSYGMGFDMNNLDDLTPWNSFRESLETRTGLILLKSEPIKKPAIGFLSLWKAK